MKPSIVLHSDGGAGSLEFVKMAGIIETLCPDTDVVDASHFFEKGNVPQVSAYLFTTIPFWPAGTIFVSCVNEGKNIITVFNNGSCLLSPDNGAATMTVDNFGYKEAYLLKEEYQTEFGLVKAAAALAGGKEMTDIGVKMEEEIYLFRVPAAEISEGLALGEVGMLLKTFGNITFTIRTDDFEKTHIRINDMVHVTFTYQKETVWEKTVPYKPSFGYVEEGEAVVFNGSSGYMDIGLNKRSFIAECIPQILTAEHIGDYKVRIEKVTL